MRIKHVSDTHGRMFSFDNRAHILIHSGDMLPNSVAILNGDIEGEINFQKGWVKKNISLFPKSFLFTLGNHDFVDAFELESLFQENKIKAYCLHDKVVSFGGMNYYGFPYIPRIGDRWNYECTEEELAEHSNNLIDKIDEINCIVAHAPLYGILDNHVQYYGNSILLNKLMYSGCMGTTLKYFMHGHMHESPGVSVVNNVLFSNAATTSNIIEVA